VPSTPAVLAHALKHYATRMRDDIPRLLTRHGFEIDARDPYSFYLGCVQLVLRDKGEFVGVADPRRDGSAEGPSE